MDPNVDMDAASARVGPGMLLRKARESAQIGLNDVAAQLHLDARTVVSLERDAFDELPAPTFVRGYLRGYARLLSVPVGPVMEAYDREGFHPPDLVADISERSQARSGDLPMRLLTYLIVVVLALLVVWWWLDRESGSEVSSADALGGIQLPGVALPGSSDSGGANDAPETSPALSAESGSSTPAPASEALSTTESSSDTAAPTSTTAAGEADRTLDLNARVETELAQVERSLAQSEPDSEQETESDAAPSDAQAEAAVPAPDADAAASEETPPAAAATEAAPETGDLRVEFPIEAWVEIYDATKTKLFFNLVKPGRVLELRGKPPIRVLLGRSDGVSLSYNGETVDLSPYVRKGGVAQLTLGE